jgi:16S rRNA (uracil1498-N3)-methyltransferase
MHRFYLPPAPGQVEVLVLDGPEAQHGWRVLRLKPGERVIVLDGAGHEFLCAVRKCSRAEIQLGILEKKFIPAKPWQITLLQAIPKGKTFEDIIQKGVELGVSRIVPLLSERVLTHLDGAGALGKAAKWRRVAIEAIKQCGSAWLPQIEVPLAPRAFLARRETFDLPLIASLQGDRRHAQTWFAAYVAKQGRPPQSVCVWIGPEGDFTPAEVSAVQAAGAWPISLGDLVLRTDTAAIYSLSILNHELQSAFA